MNQPAITIRDLRKTYGELNAVDGLDLTINTGEIFAILGPNGAGKSTTVEILEGFRKRTSGEATVLGLDPAHPTREWRERLGIMLQSTSTNAPLTVREMVAHQSHLFPHPRDVEETIAEVGLEEKANVRSTALSGGQRRRLDVALAVVGRPELMFLDEPTTGFDPEARRQFWHLIESLKDGGTTVVLTTHYLDEAEHLADRLAVIARGKMVALDTPAGLRARAADAVVAWSEPGADGAVTSRTEVTKTPTATVRGLLATHDGEVKDLEIRRPSLEDVYLDLIGKTDDEASAEGDAAMPGEVIATEEATS
ncbi:ABC transporter ATP-binding protein [Demequina aurantiaca]|uniref:ABC transporter ATP-binding protein n=1 Tax=Demequina aurantiaca TaxID=676200 RepID=UPI000781D528|nr:ABC transporter ATP-binding protein [Demequina aurantiaca]